MCNQTGAAALCATHARPLFLEMLDTVEHSSKITSSQSNALTAVAIDYASSPAGLKRVRAAATRYGKARRPEIARILVAAAQRGEEIAAASKAVRAQSQARKTRRDALAWARGVTTHRAAYAQYRELVAHELGLTEPAVGRLVRALRAQFERGELAPATPLDQVRYITVLADGRTVGTPTDEANLAVIAHLEDLCARAREASRNQSSHVDERGGRWVTHENDVLSAVLRLVRYDAATRTLKAGLAIPGADADQADVYTYRDVSRTLVRALVRSRDMGRLYAYAFSPKPDGGSLEGATVRDYSFAAHAANRVLPIAKATGPVPGKYLADLGFTAQA